MFETKFVSVSKKVVREYKDGQLVREQIVINDGGTSQEEVEARLKKAEERMDRVFNRMDNMFSDMDKMFKDVFDDLH